MSGERAIQATVRGLVQGVGFRYQTRRAAEQIGATGWVRNSADGSVEVLAQGAPAAVEAMIQFLETGPPSAQVASIEITEVPLEADRTRFLVT